MVLKGQERLKQVPCFQGVYNTVGGKDINRHQRTVQQV